MSLLLVKPPNEIYKFKDNYQKIADEILEGAGPWSDWKQYARLIDMNTPLSVYISGSQKGTYEIELKKSFTHWQVIHVEMPLRFPLTIPKEPVKIHKSYTQDIFIISGMFATMLAMVMWLPESLKVMGIAFTCPLYGKLRLTFKKIRNVE